MGIYTSIILKHIHPESAVLPWVPAQSAPVAVRIPAAEAPLSIIRQRY